MQALLHPTAMPFESKGPFKGSGPGIQSGLSSEKTRSVCFHPRSQLGMRSTGHPAVGQSIPAVKEICMGKLNPSTRDTR